MKASTVFCVVIGLMFNVIKTQEINDSMELGFNHKVGRIERHISFLMRFCSKNKLLLLEMQKERKEDLWCLDYTIYQHELNSLCMKKIIKIASISPMFETWRLFLTLYRDIDTELFIREFSIIIFCAYKNLIFSLFKPTSKVSFHEIESLSARIMSLPIDQVLDALDLCYREFLIIMQDYGISVSTNWNEYLKDHWWVIPVTIVSLIVSIAKYSVLRPFMEKTKEEQGATLKHVRFLDQDFTT